MHSSPLLPLEMLHGDQILRNEDYRKEELRKEVRITQRVRLDYLYDLRISD